MIVTVDTGTTNTRIRLFENYNELWSKKYHIGIRNVSFDGIKVLEETISKGIKELQEENNYPAISAIMASGMICSELGLYNVPHLPAPVNANILAANLKKVCFNNITDIPFYFIPGVKCRTVESGSNCGEVTDMMRGEETEAFGVADIKNITSPAVMVLPGSHTKTVKFNGSDIISCTTAMSGELIDCISKNTVLKSSLPEKLLQEIDQNCLMEGYKCCSRIGIGASLFKVRVSDIMNHSDKTSLSNFFVGAILADDINNILSISDGESIYIGGSAPLRKAFFVLLKSVYDAPVIELNDKESDLAVAYGALKIAKNAGLVIL